MKVALVVDRHSQLFSHPNSGSFPHEAGIAGGVHRFEVQLSAAEELIVLGELEHEANRQISRSCRTIQNIAAATKLCIINNALISINDRAIKKLITENVLGLHGSLVAQSHQNAHRAK